MKSWLLHIIVNTIAILIVSFLFDGVVIGGIFGALSAAFILSILNAIVRPILVVLTLPITILSLGLFLFVINAITLLLTDAILGSIFEIAGFFTAILAAIVISLLNLLLNSFIKND
ncbi:phage holin family protein [Thalassobacillus pellis]|uniref:phage holin family protein n=1 Tax=Thalassobacillus pellis TaxID=748008 RepID=UPI0019609375|nr:phage holin family protein [Thalassobacillus pellis]MBM7551389.1 putative membrane protein [Thalassobacillus pellis]